MKTYIIFLIVIGAHAVGVSSVNPPACGSDVVDLSKSSDELSIPVEGQTLNEDKACTYTITGNDAKKLAFNLTLLNLPDVKECSNYYIQVADTSAEIDNSGYKYCGTDLPKDIYVSTKNTLYITVKIKKDAQTPIIKGTYFKVPATEEICGSNNVKLTQMSGELSIPVQGQRVIIDTVCSYTITSDDDRKLAFSLSKLNLPDVKECSNYYIQVADTSAEIDNSGYKYCGTDLPKDIYVSTKNTLYITVKMKKDTATPSIVGTFFKAPALVDVCGSDRVELTKTAGEISVPAEGQQLVVETECSYTITGNDDKNLVFNLSTLNLHKSDNCVDDYIQVADTVADIDKSDYKYCGSELPKIGYVSKSNTLYITVKVKTDPSKAKIKGTYYKYDKSGATMLNSHVWMFILSFLILGYHM